MSGSRAHDREIFDQAKTHNPSVSFRDELRTPGPRFLMRSRDVQRGEMAHPVYPTLVSKDES